MLATEDTGQGTSGTRGGGWRVEDGGWWAEDGNRTTESERESDAGWRGARLTLLELYRWVKSSRHPFLSSGSNRSRECAGCYFGARELLARAQIRGRPMPSDRQSWRAVLLATGIVCTTVCNGCFTSSFVRRTPDPAPDAFTAPNDSAGDRGSAQNTAPQGRVDSSVRSASVRAADVPTAGAAVATPFVLAPGPGSPAPAGEFPLELQAAPGGPNGKTAPSAPGGAAPSPTTEPAPPASTPLLDAAIQRVAEVSREQREAIAASPGPDPPDTLKWPQPPVSLLNSEAPGPKNPPTEHDGVPLPARISAVSPQDDHHLGAEPTAVGPHDAPTQAQGRPRRGRR